MRELGLDGLSEDGRFLIARDHSTEETFHIPADRPSHFPDRAPLPRKHVRPVGDQHGKFAQPP